MEDGRWFLDEFPRRKVELTGVDEPKLFGGAAAGIIRGRAARTFLHCFRSGA